MNLRTLRRRHAARTVHRAPPPSPALGHCTGHSVQYDTNQDHAVPDIRVFTKPGWVPRSEAKRPRFRYERERRERHLKDMASNLAYLIDRYRDFGGITLVT